MELRAAPEAWPHKLLDGMIGYEVQADICRYGAQTRDRYGRCLGCASDTVRIKNARLDLAHTVGLPCLRDAPHSVLAGLRVAAVGHGKGHC